MDRNGIFQLVGFLMLLHGVLTLVFLLVGVRLTYLAWIDNWGGTAGLLIRLFLVIGGILLMYLGSSRARD